MVLSKSTVGDDKIRPPLNDNFEALREKRGNQ